MRAGTSKRFTVDGAVLTEARHDKEAKYDASSWLLALRQEDGGALRHSPSSDNWQSHVHTKPRLLCGSPRSWLGRMLSVSCSRAFIGSLVSAADDQLEGTDGCVPELADLFSAEQFCLILTFHKTN